jgi:hypothetical protein
MKYRARDPLLDLTSINICPFPFSRAIQYKGTAWNTSVEGDRLMKVSSLHSPQFNLPAHLAILKYTVKFKNSAGPKLINVPSVQILSQNINQSLGPAYCMVNSEGFHDCVSSENRYFASANLTYHIPLSKFWDEISVSLVFK